MFKHISVPVFSSTKRQALSITYSLTCLPGKSSLQLNKLTLQEGFVIENLLLSLAIFSKHADNTKFPKTKISSDRKCGPGPLTFNPLLKQIKSPPLPSKQLLTRGFEESPSGISLWLQVVYWKEKLIFIFIHKRSLLNFLVTLWNNSLMKIYDHH